MSIPADQREKEKPTQPLAPIPSNFREYMISFGPGIVMVLSWLGAGDLVDMSVSGAHYGYNLMWGMVLALVLRYILVNVISKYALTNVHQETIIQGYNRLSKYLPLFFGISSLLLAHFYAAYLIKGAGEALLHLTNVGNTFFWSIIVVVASLILVVKGIYNTVEITIKGVLILMVISLVGSALWVGPDIPAIAKGTVAFSVPENVGGVDTLVFVFSLIGAVAGSMSNLIYPYLFKEKGWQGPKYLKLQRYDLLFGVVMIIIIDLAVWTLGAEVLYPKGLTVESVSDMAKMLTLTLGMFGGILFYLGVLGACFKTVIVYALGFGTLFVDAVHTTFPERAKKYEREYTKDPIYKLTLLVTVVSPLIWALPSMPGFVYLTIIVNAFQIILLPAVAIGLMVLTNRKDLLGEYANKWWENVLLLVLIGLTLWSTWHLIVSLF
ncbi:Mn2+/Fe2+ transporter [Peribacillus cavernae]|uniref:Mn2+/Fe2+ transporter n=1 Tax=Peribacillus cavernae TaxID=1674310 RepID=A0A3S0VAK1_9BACI|nr:Nramp family divalent metal transporter [Peribacillus cavernae]MDQ0217688.1 Mn2+/Fe2+ NRAMP family transporter [Peribacillus cavernae]RUQ28158.1 Mn2+/Fe2+ transporter [Peribacillus cavernae]